MGWLSVEWYFILLYKSLKYQFLQCMIELCAKMMIWPHGGCFFE